MNLTETELMELQRQAGARNGRADAARHARLILLLSDGLTWAEIRSKLDCSDSYIDRWSKRFAADRLAGLFARHAGRERYKVTDRIEARVLARTTKHKPADGSTHWSTRKLAAELGGDISHMTVARIWAKHGIKPHRLEGYLASNDPDFEAKAADVIGLYLNPPQNSLVLSVDEKPSIQALERARGYVQTSSGKIVQGMKSTYKRHGTINLFAALEVATGIIRGKTTQTKKRADFQAFMDEVIADQPAERQIHVILDNLSTHKRNDEWLAAHPTVTFHFTPTSASWLNQVEIWFGIFQRKALRNASFGSIDQLIGAIRDFTAAYNENATPFVWRKRDVKGSQLRNTIVNLRN